MTLAEIVKSRGGDLYDGGRRASIPGPGHSRLDRSASLMIGRSGRLIVHSFGRSTVLEILNDLRSEGLVDCKGFPTGTGAPAKFLPAPNEGAKRERALELWSHGVPVAMPLSERHLEARGLELNIRRRAGLRHHPQCPYAIYKQGTRGSGPALMAQLLRPDGTPSAIEITYLDSCGRRDERRRLSRKTVGVVPPGAFVQLGPPGTRLVVGEGVVTTLSAMQLFDRSGRALLGALNLARCVIPGGVTDVIIAADRGRVGEGAALTLRQRLEEHGIAARIELPAPPYDDFNSMLVASLAGRGEGGGGWAGPEE